MQAHQHFAEGQDLLAQARTAKDPSRLIGMAQAHFAAVQALAAAAAHAGRHGMEPAEVAAWEAAEKQQYGPDGKPVEG